MQGVGALQTTQNESRLPSTSTRRPMSDPLVTVVLPVLNEAENLPWLLERIPTHRTEIVMVDGGSTDGSRSVARRLRPDIIVLGQCRPGKGCALVHGYRRAAGDVLITLDADGSTDPAEIPRFVEALLNGADFAKGTREAEGGGSDDLTRLRRFGNRVLTWLANRRLHTDYSDFCYGYNAFWRDCLPSLTFTAPGCDDSTPRPGDGFEIETFMHVRARQTGLHVVEVPSYERRRMHGTSHLRTFSDGFRCLATLLRGGRIPRREAVDLGGSGAEVVIKPCPSLLALDA
jgi:glycosyltransferase involved in cell wall biosynthesis